MQASVTGGGELHANMALRGQTGPGRFDLVPFGRALVAFEPVFFSPSSCAFLPLCPHARKVPGWNSSSPWLPDCAAHRHCHARAGQEGSCKSRCKHSDKRKQVPLGTVERGGVHEPATGLETCVCGAGLFLAFLFGSLALAQATWAHHGPVAPGFACLVGLRPAGEFVKHTLNCFNSCTLFLPAERPCKPLHSAVPAPQGDSAPRQTSANSHGAACEHRPRRASRALRGRRC